MLEVEHNIPIPPDRRTTSRHYRKRVYPWDEMEIGDSFFVEGLESARFYTLVRQATKRRADQKFIVRTVDGGARVWRIQ